MDLLPLLKKKLYQNSLITSQNRWVIAVSGGVDSIVLLDLLDRLKNQISLQLIVAHLNHGVRGRSSKADAQFVFREAKKRGLEVRLKTLPQGFFKGKGNFQDTARELRYGFFLKVAKAFKAQKVITAHQADDQLETFLMRLLRGAGPEGVKGMTLERSLKEGEKTFEIIRPLLFFSRDQIMSYARRRQLKWREDASNHKEDYLRNRVRKRLVVELKRLSPRIVANVSQALSDLQKDERFFLKLVETGFRAHKSQRRGEFRMDLTWLKGQEEALRFRLYRKALEEGGVGLKSIGRTQLESINQMVVTENRRARVSLPRGFGAYVTEKHLIFKKWSKTARPQKRGFFC